MRKEIGLEPFPLLPDALQRAIARHRPVRQPGQSELARKVDRRALKRERKMDVAKSPASIVDTAPMSMNVRTLVRSSRSPNETKPSYDSATSNDAFAAGAASIAELETLMGDLQAARDYLQSEGERVRQINANYLHLAQTASASARVISDSIGKWNIPEKASGHQLPVAIVPSAAPDNVSVSSINEESSLSPPDRNTPLYPNLDVHIGAEGTESDQYSNDRVHEAHESLDRAGADDQLIGSINEKPSPPLASHEGAGQQTSLEPVAALMRKRLRASHA